LGTEEMFYFTHPNVVQERKLTDAGDVLSSDWLL